MGCYAASAITAVTVQNTLGVQAVHPVPLDILEGQIDAVLSDIGADAVKIGLLHSAEVVNIVADKIGQYGIHNVVLDPVMVSTSGHRLIEENAVEHIKRRLMPLVRVVTPNLPEAEILSGRIIENEADFPDAAKSISNIPDGGTVSVFLKAGHLNGDMLIDYFYDAEEQKMIQLPSKRIYTRNTHGTGCTLSSALAAALAKGDRLSEAAVCAKEFMSEAICCGADVVTGKGFGPVNHGFAPQKMLINNQNTNPNTNQNANKNVNQNG